jgi:hypothetical protein
MTEKDQDDIIIFMMGCQFLINHIDTCMDNKAKWMRHNVKKWTTPLLKECEKIVDVPFMNNKENGMVEQLFDGANFIEAKSRLLLKMWKEKSDDEIIAFQEDFENLLTKHNLYENN